MNHRVSGGGRLAKVVVIVVPPHWRWRCYLILSGGVGSNRSTRLLHIEQHGQRNIGLANFCEIHSLLPCVFALRLFIAVPLPGPCPPVCAESLTLVVTTADATAKIVQKNNAKTARKPLQSTPQHSTPRSPAARNRQRC